MRVAMSIGEAQVKLFSECSDTDETFFGHGYKAHKGYLTRTKKTIETTRQASTERWVSQRALENNNYVCYGFVYCQFFCFLIIMEL